MEKFVNVATEVKRKNHMEDSSSSESSSEEGI